MTKKQIIWSSVGLIAAAATGVGIALIKPIIIHSSNNSFIKNIQFNKKLTLNERDFLLKNFNYLQLVDIHNAFDILVDQNDQPLGLITNQKNHLFWANAQNISHLLPKTEKFFAFVEQKGDNQTKNVIKTNYWHILDYTKWSKPLNSENVDNFDGYVGDILQNYNFESGYQDAVDNFQILFWKMINEVESRNANKTNIFQLKNKLFPNLMSPKSDVRASAWIKNTEQIKLWEQLFLIYLHQFNIEVDQVNFKINPEVFHFKNISGDYLKMELEFINGTTKTKIADPIIIGPFKSYTNIQPSDADFYLKLDREVETDKKLFNEYVTNPILRLKPDNFFGLIRYDSFSANSTTFQNYTAKAFVKFFNQWKDLFEIIVPQHRKNIDFSYKLTNAKVVDYIKTFQIVEFEVEVIKVDKTREVFSWFSIDLDKNHRHLLRGYQKGPLHAKFFNVDTFWDASTLEKQYHNSIPSGMEADSLFEGNKPIIINILEYIDQQIANKANIWAEANYKSNFEAKNLTTDSVPYKVFKTLLEKELLGLFLNNKAITWNNDFSEWNETFFSGLDHIDVTIINNLEIPGTVFLKLNLLDKDNNSLLSVQNQEKIFAWNFFKGSMQRYNAANPAEDSFLLLKKS
ncbi:hypothetical protein NV226_02215 [Mycoplasma iguanae]|uniref:Uncharacterized protein n=1 Tax=Mycoplasma iguanae TaxID=292461 RepID=A0ABY5R8N3_9MOLU|nr:hypothetical protein [Mycoplasma iguanae]UVD81527.1 hypothetical protein NV226_02215 [Mycoplasma iguanae]